MRSFTFISPGSYMISHVLSSHVRKQAGGWASAGRHGMAKHTDQRITSRRRVIPRRLQYGSTRLDGVPPLRGRQREWTADSPLPSLYVTTRTTTPGQHLRLLWGRLTKRTAPMYRQCLLHGVHHSESQPHRPNTRRSEMEDRVLTWFL